MTDVLIKNPNGFKFGYKPITQIDEVDCATGIEFGISIIEKGKAITLGKPLESAYLLMKGEVTFKYQNHEISVRRDSIFDENPFALHVPANTDGKIIAQSDAEIAISQVENNQQFEPMLFDSKNMLESERRGKGQLNDTAYRIVRTIFDKRNRPEANLVLGEVINFPGCWSSYPPHHHPQPEIYHYRFTEPQGYGHGELDDDVYKIKQYDTLKILDEKDHSQTAAPGYGMYYIWIIRHLKGNPYMVPEFTEEHRWTLEDNAPVWQPKV